MYMFKVTKTNFIDRIRHAVGMTVAIGLLSACASAPVAPTAELTAAQEAIADAEQEGARQHSGAELDEAQQKLQRAERAANNEQMLSAERLAKEAKVSAELAAARTEAAKAQEINKEMERSADALIEEMRRTGDQQ